MSVDRRRSPCSSSTSCRSTFGGLNALTELDLAVDEREIVSVIGPNGAGKTTVFNVITGVYEPTGGEVRFAGESIGGLAPHQVTRKGIARTFQSLRLFLNMSVIENVMAATYGNTKATPWESILRLPRARREEREVRSARRGGAVVLRPAVGGIPMGAARLQPVVRQPAPARDRPRARDPAEAAAARRAGGRDEPERDARGDRADRPPARRARPRDPRDRARHARGRGDLRPGRRARPRGQDHRGHVRRGRHPSGGGRGLPRPRPGGAGREPNGSSSSTTSRPTTARCGSSRGCRSTVDAGELVCLLGGNASGKSTTLKTILGLVRPRSGRVLLDGEDVTQLAGAAADRQRPRDRPREPPAVRADDGAGEPRARRGAPGRRARSTRTSSASRPCSRGSRSARTSWRGRCPAASSRWSRWAAR